MTRLRALAIAAALGAASTGTGHVPPGYNPHPVRLARPARGALSPVAEIGRRLFFDRRLSGSHALSCATCHRPDDAYGPPEDLASRLKDLPDAVARTRAVPGLRYLRSVPAFVIGPDRDDADGAPAIRTVLFGAFAAAPKVAGETIARAPLVPRGGLFWDGRAGSLQAQALQPLLNPAEMANPDAASIGTTLRDSGYADSLARALGADAARVGDARLVDEAMFAIARFEFEDRSFHPYTSRYDAWLEGRTPLTAAELRGLRVFDDPAKGNCAACHLDRPTPDGRPPDFSDWQYEALGVPRNRRLAVNRDPRAFDLGLCGPNRTDLSGSSRWCGMFRTPSLRNVATRRVFFHNGVYDSLDEVLRFYNLRDTNPDLIYPRDGTGRVTKFDDLPPALRRNVDVLDPPFDRHAGERPAMTGGEMRDVIAFLRTLTDQD